MARATPGKGSDFPRDALALLKQDHRTVETLLDDVARADESEQSSIAERLCQLLRVHTQIEEELQKIASEAAPGAVILPHALGANISGVITTAVIAAIYVAVLR